MLTDKFNRELGYLGKPWPIEGDLGAMFETGRDFDDVRELFQRLEDHRSGIRRGDGEAIYKELVDLAPRIIACDDGSETSFNAVIVSEGPKGYQITLVH